MKLKLTLIAIAFSTSVAFGTTMQINTNGGFGTFDLIDNAGDSLALTGFAAYGTYGGGAITDAASLVSQFTDAGSTGSTTTSIRVFTEIFGDTAVGFDAGAFAQTSVPGVVGEKIAIFFWKGESDMSTATEAVVFELDTTYAAPGAVPIYIDYSAVGSEGTLIFGNSKNQTLTLVPEPSSVALLGLGSVALLLRRRR